ncbi:InlB B-repeat-containing protein [Eubacterium aggregans]|uniref:InlB B-repeat-containing protein n=1 Tax=Eubacterium aggregans TaxID=81409 RepID=UPI0023EFD5C0|nr:InlB B-repeat-containing protein [Eubacterium aggregans]MDD4690996.1 InlB B-repeat-containing protein [Eubacterium aggregans]
MKQQRIRIIMGLVLAVVMITIVFSLCGLVARAEGNTTAVTKENYMSDNQYAALGFGSLKDPAAFSAEDTSNPLEGYTANTLSELFVGQMNKNDDKDDYIGSFQIMENASTADSNTLNLNNMAKNTIGKIQGYYDADNSDDMYTQCKNTIALRPGKISETNASTRDIIIEDTLYCLEDGWFYEDDSYQMVNAWTLGDDGKYTMSDHKAYNVKLDDDNWVGDIEVKQAEGLTAMAVGDFDGDDYYEVAVHALDNSGGQIIFFQPKANGSAYELKQENYSIRIGDIGNRFKFDGMEGDLERPIVQLTTTSMSGQDDLAISVSLPYDDGNEYCDSSALAIYSCQNGNTSRRFNNDLVVNNNEYRFKFPSTTNADLNGDGTDELVVAGNKNYGYKNYDTKGSISKSENLVNVVLYNGSGYELAWSKPKNLHANELVVSEDKMNAPVALTAARYNSEQSGDTLFCEGVYYHFSGASGATANEIIKNGKLTCNEKEDYDFGEEVQEIKNDNGLDYIRAYAPYISKAVTASFVEDSRMTEQTLVVSGTDSRNSFSNSDWADIDIAWVYGKNGDLIQEVTNPRYVDSQDEDDNGTLLTFCAINVDDDTVYTQYTGKNVGWSSPSVESVMLSTPYWSELDYGTAGNARGATSYSLTVSNGSGTGNSGNIGLGLGYTFGGGVGFLGTGGSMGFSLDGSAAYTHSFQNTKTQSDTLTFTSGGGNDVVGLTVTPVAIYNYNVWVPEHTATQEEVDEYTTLGLANPPAVGDLVPGKFSEMAVSVQLNPVESTVPVDTYNRTVEAYNLTVADGEKIDTVDIGGTIYPGIVTGDPSTYASDIAKTGADTTDENTRVAKSSAAIGMNEGSSTGLSMSDTTATTTSDGYSVSIKASLSETIKAGLNLVIVNLGAETKLSQSLSGGWSQTWTTTNSTGTTVSGTFPSLPKSAQTGTDTSGNPTSDYAFNTTLAQWRADLNNGEAIKMDDGSTITGRTQVVGYLVDGIDGAPSALPENLHVAATTEDSALLAWTVPSANGRKPGAYKVYYAKGSDANYQPVKRGGSDLIVNGNAAGCLVTGLSSDSDYYFRLEAYSAVNAQGTKSIKGPYAQGRTKGSTDSFMPIIDTPPTDIYADIGDVANFEIVAHAQKEGDTLSYQWQQLIQGNYTATWTDLPGQTAATFNAAYYDENGQITTANTNDLEGTIYRCVVTETSAAGNQNARAISRSATLHIGGGSDASLALNVPMEQDAVVDAADDGLAVTAISGKALGLTGSLTKATVAESAPEGNGDMSLTSTAGSEVKIHLIDEGTDTQSAQKSATIDAQGGYTAELDALAAGSYTLVATYLTDGDTKTTWSQAISLTVLDANTPHSITYKLNGGTNAYNNPATFTLDTGIITLADAEKTGATFTGWYRDAQLTQKVEEIDTAKEAGDITLYAGWENIIYTIRYELDGGINAVDNPESYTIDDHITLGAATREGYTFEGWYTDSELSQVTTGIPTGTTGDQVFYAKWKEVVPPPVAPDESGRYPISNDADLVAVAQAMATDPDTYTGANYYLTGNIDGGGGTWTLAMGNEAHPFTGTFDGQDHYILGLSMGSSTEPMGLFGTIGETGRVSNLSVINLDYTNEETVIAGGLAGINKGIIIGCGSGVNITSSGTYFVDGIPVPVSALNSDIKGKTAGGLVGINRGTITDSRNNAVVSGDVAGGIAGENTGVINNVYNIGATAGTAVAGGIAGSNSGSLAYGYNAGAITGTGSLGAIAGTSTDTGIGKFYYSHALERACGNLTNDQTGATAMAENAMRTATFQEILNTDISGQDYRGWVQKDSENRGFPRIEKSVILESVLAQQAIKPVDPIVPGGDYPQDGSMDGSPLSQGVTPMGSTNTATGINPSTPWGLIASLSALGIIIGTLAFKRRKHGQSKK